MSGLVERCPFCGSRPLIDTEKGITTVGCFKEGCADAFFTSDDRASAVAAWNRREAASRIEALEGEVERLKSRRVRYVRTNGSTLEEMRAFIRDHPLYQHGDAVLCWVNEGDLYMGAAEEIRAARSLSQSEEESR